MRHLNLKKWAKLVKQGYTDKQARELATSNDTPTNKHK